MKWYLFLFSLLLVSCSKYDHTELDLTSDCHLCDWAESRNGLYSGMMNGSAGGVQVSFDVQQVFLNQSNFDDSTRMYFQVTETWQNNGDVFQWTGSTLDSVGSIDGANGYYFVIQGDSIQVSKTEYGPGWISYSIYGTFYR